MNKFYQILAILLLPSFAFAADVSDSLSFAPPPEDLSVVLLGDIFGIVDGVLHGSGTQIMGTMFGVFNAAVLALGGIIIMYTLMVSTMNTAQEGQFLGQKWSSLWVPIRTTFGLALLIPKASGYCLMQIFVMWIILQGVGAADKIWDAALGYLNRGGAIISMPANPAKELIESAGGGGQLRDIELGAQTILAGQVCMLGLESQLKKQRQSFLQQKQQKTGPCYAAEGDSLASDYQTICNQPVPNLINTVNAVDIRNKSVQNIYNLNMPNFDSNSKYAFLNGVCGKISWVKTPVSSSLGGINQGISVGALGKSRSIAIQQMYSSLSPVARLMVNNNPLLNIQSNNQTGNNQYSSIANQQFGVPLDQGGNLCSEINSCVQWGAAPGSDAGVLFSGTEFVGAIKDYNGVMRPLLTLEKEAKENDSTKADREFISKAENSGWILAGSYFFNLVVLNQSAIDYGQKAFDSGTGLENSEIGLDNLSGAFSKGQCNPESKYSLLCTWLDKNNAKIEPIISLIRGGANNVPLVRAPTFQSIQMSVAGAADSSTVFGFTGNSPYLKQAEQPTNSIKVKFHMPALTATTQFKLHDASFDCGPIYMPFKVCIGRVMGDVLWNGIIVPIYNTINKLIAPVLEQLMMAFLMIPLKGFAFIFQDAVTRLSQPGINPVVALAQMGTYYINFAGSVWLIMLNMAVTTALIPLLGIFIFAFLALAMPLILTWLSVMVSIGFITAYYVPVLPYLIFTFGTIGWFIAVIEAMVAAPLVALGVTHPEGHEAFGKGESAVMILMNVFLRPSLMIIGYITSIAITYVAVWLLNAGYEHAISFVYNNKAVTAGSMSIANQSITGGYTGWAGIFAFFFTVLIYVSTYLILVQRSFTLITYLPDKVLRWIGGAPESIGQEAQQWGEEAKKQVGDAGQQSMNAEAAMHKQMAGYASKGLSSAKKSFGGKSGGRGASAEGSKSSKNSSSDSGAEDAAGEASEIPPV